MLRALTLSVAQLGDPPVLKVLLKSLGVTLVIFVGIAVLLYFGLDALADAIGLVEIGGTLVAASAAILALLLGWLLFRAIAVAVVGIFADDIVAAVEARHYPEALKTAKPVSFARSLGLGIGSATRAIVVNLLAAPLYVILLVTGVGTVLAFAAINALLLGRDLGEMVAARHMADGAMRSWLATTRGERALLGLVVTGLFVVPVANLVAPVLGAAMATHRFHGGKA